MFWQVNGAAAIGAGAKFVGTVMALNAVAIGASTEVNGRAMSLSGAISLNSNEFYSARPGSRSSAGPRRSQYATPAIAGTTDIPAPGSSP